LDIHLVGAKLLHADGRTDKQRDRHTERWMDITGEDNSRFLQYCYIF